MKRGSLSAGVVVVLIVLTTVARLYVALAADDTLGGASTLGTCPTPWPECVYLPFIVGAAAPSPPSGSRLLKYYGMDVVNPDDLATLSQYDIDTAVVMMSTHGPQSSWEAYITAANEHNINVVVWPLGGSGACGFPYIGTDITPVHPLLDYLAQQDRFIGIVNAHEPSWSCPMTVPQMTEIRRRLKDYVRNNSGREIQVWNYIDNITSFVTSGEIMDVALTWQHCIGGAEGSCPYAIDTIRQDRAAIDNNGWDHMDLVYAFQTFEIAGTAYRMPTADEMYDWGCQMLQTNALDGFFWYSWRNPAGYTQTLADRQDLWSTISRVYNDCANKGGDEVPTPTPTPTASPPPPTTGLDIYGVKFVDSYSDFNELKSLGVENPVVSVYSVSGLNSAITAAGNAGVKIIPWCWQTDPYGCYTLSGGSWSINSLGKEVLEIVNEEMARGEASRVLAVYGNHEPYYHGQTNAQARALVTTIRNYIENELGQTYHLKLFGKIYSDTSCAPGSACAQERDSFTDGICDYCGVMYHPYRAYPPEFRKSQMLADLNRDLNNIKGASSEQTLNEFIPYLCTIHWPDTAIYDTGLYMPDPFEMLDGGSSILNYTSTQGYRADGFLWYTWANNASWIGLDQYNADGQRPGRMEAISSIGEMPRPSP